MLNESQQGRKLRETVDEEKHLFFVCFWLKRLHESGQGQLSVVEPVSRESG